MEINVQEPNEPNVVWSTNTEYLDIMLQEKSKESLLQKSINHNICELTFIKRLLLRNDFNKDEVLELIDNFIFEKDEQVILLGDIIKEKENK